MAGFEHVVRLSPFASQSSVADSFEAAIRQSQGFIPSEALTAPYDPAAPLRDGEFLAAGQWPLFKGMMERTADNALDGVKGQLRATSTRMLTDELNAHVDEVIDRWAATVPPLAITNSNTPTVGTHGPVATGAAVVLAR